MLASDSERTETDEEEKEAEEWPETYEIEIYKLQHKTDEKLERYVGCTKDFKPRRQCHKTRCTNPKDKRHNYNVYQYIRAHGGFDAWEMTCLATEYVENKEEQDNIENEYIKLMNATLCQYKPGAYQRAGGKKEYHRQYDRDRAAKFDLIGNSQPCACGGKFTKAHKHQHKQSQKHKRYEASLHQDTAPDHN